MDFGKDGSAAYTPTLMMGLLEREDGLRDEAEEEYCQSAGRGDPSITMYEAGIILLRSAHNLGHTVVEMNTGTRQREGGECRTTYIMIIQSGVPKPKKNSVTGNRRP
jgi:hypothetical protein